MIDILLGVFIDKETIDYIITTPPNVDTPSVEFALENSG